MKIYVLEYDIADFNNNLIHRVDKYNECELGDFIEDCKRRNSNDYTRNIRAYSGFLSEVDIEDVINPF